MIRIEDLDFAYGADGFRMSIDELAVGRGEAVAVIGPSGSGKTTLLHLIAGIVTPNGGRIEANGVEVSSLGDAGRRDFRVRNIGLVFQEFELLEYLTVLDNILMPYRINPKLALDASVRERARSIASDMGLGDKLGRYPRKLSQGERQRVAVCRAVLPEPALLMADEPTGNLDPGTKGRVLDLLFDYADRTGTTLLTVTHDHDLLPRFERVVDFGTLVA